MAAEYSPGLAMPHVTYAKGAFRVSRSNTVTSKHLTELRKVVIYKPFDWNTAFYVT